MTRLFNLEMIKNQLLPLDIVDRYACCSCFRANFDKNPGIMVQGKAGLWWGIMDLKIYCSEP